MINENERSNQKNLATSARETIPPILLAASSLRENVCHQRMPWACQGVVGGEQQMQLDGDGEVEAGFWLTVQAGKLTVSQCYSLYMRTCLRLD